MPTSSAGSADRDLAEFRTRFPSPPLEGGDTFRAVQIDAPPAAGGCTRRDSDSEPGPVEGLLDLRRIGARRLESGRRRRVLSGVLALGLAAGAITLGVDPIHRENREALLGVSECRLQYVVLLNYHR